MKGKKIFSLRWKLIIGGLALLIIPLLIAGIIIYNSTYNGVIGMIEYSLKKQTGNWKTVVSAAAEEIKTYKQSAIQSARLQVGEKAEAIYKYISESTEGPDKIKTTLSKMKVGKT